MYQSFQDGKVQSSSFSPFMQILLFPFFRMTQYPHLLNQTIYFMLSEEHKWIHGDNGVYLKLEQSYQCFQTFKSIHYINFRVIYQKHKYNPMISLLKTFQQFPYIPYQMNSKPLNIVYTLSIILSLLFYDIYHNSLGFLSFV